MKKIIPALSLLALSATVQAQQARKPDGGGSYQPSETECVSTAERTRIEAMLAANIIRLKQEGKLPADWGTADREGDVAGKPTAGNFIWPLKQQPGFSYNSVYGISNFVDLDPLFPGHVQDWNCGSRSYDDASGYNHAGIDIFLWPFSQTMQQEEQVAIIAAADGIIIGKDDGYDDHSCVMSGQPWNAVYIGNADGTICWYGHMKKNSQTGKAVGESITAGEFLGFVGSSGNSTGPHLHFETHTSGGDILEPFSGPCNPGTSLWASQKPYIDPTINALMTHNHAPVFPDCPQQETIYDTDYFYTGDTVFLASYFHDQTNIHAATYTIYRPDNSVFNTWNNTSNTGYYAASYWYWYWKISNTWPSGAWTFSVSYEGNTVTHTFHVNETQTGIAEQATGAAPAIFPNPGHGAFQVKGLEAQDLPYHYRVTDISGRAMASGILNDVSGKLQPLPFSKGMYLLQLEDKHGHRSTLKFMSY